MITESGRSLGEGNGNPLQLLLPGRSHGQGSLVGYSPWGFKESYVSEPLTLTSSKAYFVKKKRAKLDLIKTPNFFTSKENEKGTSGGLVVKTLRFQCKGLRFNL